MKSQHPKAIARRKSAPVKAAEPESFAQPLEVGEDKWARLPPPGGRLYGLSRSYLDALCVEGKIQSALLRAPGARRGVRLIYRPSIEAFLAAAMTDSSSTKGKA